MRDHAELLEVLALLEREHQGAQQRGWTRQGHSARLAVMRGALWGDVAQLVSIGPRVLSPRQRVGLRLGALLGERRRTQEAAQTQQAQAEQPAPEAEAAGQQH